MKNSTSVTCHLHEPDTVRVAALYPDPIHGRDEIHIYCGAFGIIASPVAAAELAKQLTAHLAGLARRENLKVAEGVK